MQLAVSLRGELTGVAASEGAGQAAVSEGAGDGTPVGAVAPGAGPAATLVLAFASEAEPQRRWQGLPNSTFPNPLTGSRGRCAGEAASPGTAAQRGGNPEGRQRDGEGIRRGRWPPGSRRRDPCGRWCRTHLRE